MNLFFEKFKIMEKYLKDIELLKFIDINDTSKPFVVEYLKKNNKRILH